MDANRRGFLALGAGATLALGAGGSRIFGGGAAAQDPEFRGSMGPFRRLPEPVMAPEIAFRDAGGRELTLADFRGRVLAVNFWATWCAPCVEEMPALDRLHAAQSADQVEVVAISLDRGGLRQVAPFFTTHDLHLPVYLDPVGASARAFSVRGLPTTVVIDPDGREFGRLEGAAAWDSPAARKMLRALRIVRPATART
ncbi:MAG: TlpA family protein disulfide reductase [Proteobacteria bacterium]|nr:TlpA family protein disulfide reductase [Pseudomonadota bacterium]